MRVVVRKKEAANGIHREKQRREKHQNRLNGERMFRREEAGGST